MQSKIKIRVAVFTLAVVFASVFVSALKAEEETKKVVTALPEAPVATGFTNKAEVDPDKIVIPRKYHLYGVDYQDYDADVAFDYSNFDCPANDNSVNGRTIPKYHDDFPIHDTYEYQQEAKKTPCSEFYYPSNYRVPR